MYRSTTNIMILIPVALLIGIAVGWLITTRWGKLNRESQSGIEVTRSRMLLTAFVLIAFLLVAGAGWLIYSLMPTPGTIDQPEIQMGLIVVTAIAAMMTLLFIVAAGFSFMNLTDPKQPLGLPEGSIRAMIALVLIMVFIIFGIYLFRVVGYGYYTAVEKDLSAEDLNNLDLKKYAGMVTNIEKNQNDNTYTVWLQTKTSDDGARLAQQLVTTVGTLVVAVAGFYFGSTAVSSAVAAAQGAMAVSHPTITDVSPDSGRKGETITLEIIGTDFKSPKSAGLARGSDTVVGTEITSSPTMIRCKLTLDKGPGGDKWDVIVENEDGKQARKEKIFTINPPETLPA